VTESGESEYIVKRNIEGRGRERMREREYIAIN